MSAGDAAVVDGSTAPLDAGPSIDARPPVDAFVTPCTWSSVAPWRLTTPPGDQTLLDVAAVPTGFLVTTGSSNDPPHEPGRFVRRVGLRAALAERVALFPMPRGSFRGGVSLAVGPVSALAATWDEGGCMVRQLGLDGTPAASSALLSLRSCVGSFSTDLGFALFDRPGDSPAAVHTLDVTSSEIVSSGPDLEVLDGAVWWSRARLPDQSLLVVGMRAGVEPTSAVAQRLDAHGEPLSAIVDLPAFAAASRIRAVATSTGALVAWLEQPDGDPTSQERVLRVVAVDTEGRPRAAPILASVGPAYRDAGLSLAAIDAGVLVAYVESDPGDRFGRATRLVAMRLTEDGEPVERIVIAEASFARTPVLRVLGDDALLAFTASDEGIATQVFIAGLECR